MVSEVAERYEFKANHLSTWKTMFVRVIDNGSFAASADSDVADGDRFPGGAVWLMTASMKEFGDILGVANVRAIELKPLECHLAATGRPGTNDIRTFSALMKPSKP
ncbi:UNVERIFIED_ORG: hypothetical protein GGI57_000904 [Rhizobium aethiopicum]